ncbi:MAG: DUF2225 domain-containing protein [Anaerovibrio sp.]|uniref:DUF2225 domain-containing protein n=1 Tax=Anaerovibrio sp. TaxID=1872532 RepID=UPI0025EC0275|nr:DUF2225 domain-containing protein [Anaerovibrio sp.]MCR5177197.1 DUF2225 domain-containing protein [Anaerovibrio sp.]
MPNEFTFVVEKNCPVCGEKTRVVKVKSRLMVQHTDDDYCCHYRDFNPYYYTILACEHCGFAADEKHFLTPLPDRHRAMLAQFLKERRVSFIFTPERKLPDAVASYQLAIYCAEAINAPLSRLAGLSLRMSWIYRLTEMKEQEMEWAHKAIDYYERSLMTERYPVESLSDNTVMYLLATLFNRVGDRDHCVGYLSRLINDKELKMKDSKVYYDARKMWQDIRAEENEAKGANQTTAAK